MKKLLPALTALLGLALMVFCGQMAQANQTLRMATTTSTANTGLLDYLAPQFQKDTGIELQWVAVGTGKALKLGQNCDVHILMVHAPPAEKEYVKQGYGIDRHEIMYNDFVIIGPPEDKAAIKGENVEAALKKIASQKVPFASRGDNSGTNKKELLLWKNAGFNTPIKQDWYVETGQGMLNTITIATEKKAYTMTDRGTFIKFSANHKGNPPLVVLVEGDNILFNQYSVMLVNPKRCPKVKPELAKKFSDWIRSAKIQQMIKDFRLLGKELFIPNAK
ncbi:substrate-binding domain-containing protein [Dethiosulfatarculus sandiegensis]|uniref:Tungsten ABC transporter substrate-binding protein n=1 Tax=Dethiosulfatarculus sandiegensis TaxID=1429043 RepID=A0A0D2GAE2_9BACT|nr:substrate-binding domain-containing protein [Dethiosulfatarculus sandiegensis]KIX11857.1 tungsten ABC transporter substrate-binding protein [Dethiosulfatarculus sandiegensis]